MNKADISSPVKAYLDMSQHWKVVEALKGGQLSIKEATTDFLPREPAESLAAYRNRLERSSLFNVYRATVRALSGEPFQRPIILTDEPQQLSYLQYDTDTSGRSLTNFARDILDDLLTYGKAHILVDYPTVEEELSVGEERQLNIRPYFVQVPPPSLIGWRTERVGGMDMLQSLRIKSSVSEFSPSNEWEEKEAEYIRHITPQAFELYRRDNKKWVLVDSAVNTLGFVPLVTIYANKTGTLEALPTLEDLANLNIRHYQKLSDLDNIEHIANVPLLFASGFTDGELEGVEIGPNRLIGSTEVNAKLQYVEHSGAAISASQLSIKEIEGRMLQMGASILQQRGQQRETATARLVDRGELMSDLQVIVRNLEAGLERAYYFAGEWVGITTPTVNVDIGDTLSIPVEANATNDLITLASIGVLTSENLVDELKRRGILSATFKVTPQQIDENTPTELPVE